MTGASAAAARGFQSLTEGDLSTEEAPAYLSGAREHYAGVITPATAAVISVVNVPETTESRPRRVSS